MKRARMLLSIWPCLLLLIWPPWPLSVNSVGVDPPSASNAMSMASSLLQTLTENEFGDPLDGGEDNRRRNRPEMCKVKNLKQQQKMSMAKLDAHRCLIRDVVVQVPVPDTLIATYVHPSHVVVPRCTGLCLERPGCTCVPKKSRHIKVDIVVGINSTSVDQMCSQYEIEEHRGPCRCKCLTKSCHYNKDLDRDNCQCRCKAEFAALKRECATTGRSTRQWDEETCNCRCKPRVCVEGHYQDAESCDCKPVESTCSAVGVRGAVEESHSSETSLTGATKYIGLTCVALLATILMIFMYLLISRRRNGSLPSGISSFNPNTLSGLGPHGLDGSIASLTGTLRGHNGHGHPPATTAYTITINSQGGSNLDESVLPLTEDKTRF